VRSQTSSTTSPPAIAVLKKRVDLALGWVVTLLMGLAVVNVLWQVFTRYVLEDPSAYTGELARFLLIWIGLLGASYAVGGRLHLAIDLLPGRLKGGRRHVLGIVIDGLVLLFALAVMVFGGLSLVSLTLMLEQTSAALRIPLGYVYLALPVSGLLVMFYATLFLIEHVQSLRGREPALPETERTSADAIAEEAVDPVAGAVRPRAGGRRGTIERTGG